MKMSGFMTDKKDDTKKESTTKKVSKKVNEVLPSTGEKVGLLGILAGSTLLSGLLVLRFRRR